MRGSLRHPPVEEHERLHRIPHPRRRGLLLPNHRVLLLPAPLRAAQLQPLAPRETQGRPGHLEAHRPDLVVDAAVGAVALRRRQCHHDRRLVAHPRQVSVHARGVLGLAPCETSRNPDPAPAPLASVIRHLMRICIFLGRCNADLLLPRQMQIASTSCQPPSPSLLGCG